MMEQYLRGFAALVTMVLVLLCGMHHEAAALSMEQLEKVWMGAYGADTGPVVDPLFKTSLLEKAQSDGCFYAIGDERNSYDPSGFDPEACLVDGGHPKVNQAYVWGLTQSNNMIWFGTAPNVHCLVLGTYLQSTDPMETESWVCEFGDSAFCPPVPPEIGDWRPPRIFAYDTDTKTLVEHTPASPLIQLTVGIRSAGALGDVVLMGGPKLSVEGGINLFAFTGSTGEFLGATTLTEYNNIRKWLIVDGFLYTAVGYSDPDNDQSGGKVLRWRGNRDDPFQFEIVGELDSSGAELAYHDGRLFVSTWPGSDVASGSGLAGLWMSPVIPPLDGLTTADAEGWRKVWQVDDYEPDPVTAATYGGGALASFGGYLYWGTMHVPLLSTLAHIKVYGPPQDELDLMVDFLGTYRAISIFRGRHFATIPTIELLYGMDYVPSYTEETGWQLKPNNMGGQPPLYGPSGFGNCFNNYTWTMGIAADQLLVGTMDWSYLFYDVLNNFFISQVGRPPSKTLYIPQMVWGADMWRFPSSDSAAVPESLNGLGNYLNYGIRNGLSNGAFYPGTANPMNLMTDPDDRLPQGGWELYKMTKDAVPLIRANGSAHHVVVSASEPVSVTVSLDPGTFTNAAADWWICARNNATSEMFSYVYQPAVQGWKSGFEKTAVMYLFKLHVAEILNMKLPVGDYTFYFVIDDIIDDYPGMTWWDSVTVSVQ